MPDTSHITTSGGLISIAFIENIREVSTRQAGTEPATFDLPWSAAPANTSALEAQIAAAWELLCERWDAVWDEIHSMDVSDVRRRWLLPLFELLDFNPVYIRGDVVLDEAGKLRYPLSHRGWRDEGAGGARAPVLHSVAPRQKLDERVRGGRGQGLKAKSPHDLVQAFLNADPEQRWAVVSNGILLRLLREYHHTFTKGYVQFDLESMFETRNYADFRALYRMCHASRFRPPLYFPPEGGKEEEAVTPLERFYQDSVATGIQVGDDLREQVREAIETLGNGFLGANPTLIGRLQGDDELCQRFYGEILHTIYRVLFLLFAEQRGMLPGRDSLYAETYAIARLRERAEGDIPRQDDFTDLWAGLQATFRMVREGAPALGVFGYDGMLFAEDQTPLLEGDAETNAAGVRNSDLLHAIRALTLIEREGVLQRISYADLGVEELGSIYESLLDFTPRVTARTEAIDGREVPPHSFVLDPRGSARKTTGSYYTDDSLVNQLIKTALLPVAHDRLAKAGLPVIEDDEVGEGAAAAASGGLLTDYVELTPQQRAAGAGALLDLKVCDPAAGSGHFLVAANNTLAAELARIRTGEPYPTEGEIQAAKRDVLAHCLYAVDLNPMAVELCKVSLWINASVRDEPLNFLDHHIKCGNSLVGATPALVRDGIPYEAFALGRAGDDREYAKAIRAQNRQERRDFEQAGAAQLGLFQVTRLFEPVNARAWDELDELAQVAPQAARERFEAYQSDDKAANAKLVADTWTAAFFWPLRPDAPSPPTFATFHELMLTRDAQALTPAQRQMVAALAEKHRFFHWHLAFPRVFEGDDVAPASEDEAQGGFDVVLGNPPWERIKLQEKEFFAAYDSPEAEAIAEASTAATRRRLIKKLPASRPGLHAAYTDALHVSEALSTFLRESGRYPLSAVGDINTYQVFAGLVRQIVDGRGRVGIVLPTGIATDYYNQDYFAAIVDNRELVSLYDFENRAKLFPEVDSRYKFSLLTLAGRATPAAEAEFAFFLHRVDDLADGERRFTLMAEDLARINPNTKTCPVFRTRRDAELTAKLYRAAPVLVNEATGENPWGVSFLRMFDMANDSRLFHTREELEAQGFTLAGNRFVRGDEVYLPLYEGRMIHHFDHRAVSVGVSLDTQFRSGRSIDTTAEQHRRSSFVNMPRYWVEKTLVEKQLGDRKRDCMYVFKDISSPTNERSFIGTVIPCVAVGHTAPIMSFEKAESLEICGAVANLSTYAFDFVTRQKMGGIHLTYFILEQLPVLPVDGYTSRLLSLIVPRILELTYTAWDLRPFADDVWAEAGPELREALRAQWEANVAATGGGHRGAVPPEWAPAPGEDPWPYPPFIWDEDRRARLRAELDGLYAHLYGLTREELAYILETFPIVKRKDEARWGEYRTKRLVLEAYERLNH